MSDSDQDIEVHRELARYHMEAIRHNQRSGNITAFFTSDLDKYTKLYQVNIGDVSMYVIFDLTLNELSTSLPKHPKEIRYYAIGTSIF